MNELLETALRGSDILVTGATGFTGSRLVRRLAAAGAHVRAIARSNSSVDSLADVDIRWFRGQVFDAATVAAAAEGVHYIFHLAAAYREARANEEASRQVHVESTRQLAEAALRNPSFKRFVHISTVGVHGHIAHPPADESAPFNPGDVYQQTKAEGELWVREFAAARRMPLTVLRPAAIYGPGDRRLLKLAKMVARGVFPILGRGNCLYHLIHVDDLVQVLMLAAIHPAALNEVFIVGNPESTTLPHMADIIAAALGRRVRVVRLPAWPFFALAAVAEAVCLPLGLEPPIYRRRVAFYTKDRSFDTRKLRDVLGYSVRVSSEEGLTQTARWYADQGWIRG